jgi:hypothetical protein
VLLTPETCAENWTVFPAVILPLAGVRLMLGTGATVTVALAVSDAFATLVAVTVTVVEELKFAGEL